MAKNKFIEALRKSFGIGQVTDIENDTTIREYRSITSKEFAKTVSENYVPNTHRSASSFNAQHIPAMIEPVTRDLLDRKMDNDKLAALAPEVSQAASILIPSILSPNDFCKNVFTLVVKGGNESDDIKTKISELLKYHFEKELKLHVKLSDWIEKAMFNDGCKAILVLPTSFIAKLKEDLTATENYKDRITSFGREITTSIESLSITGKDRKTFKTLDDDIVDSIFRLGLFDNEISSTKLSDRSNTERSIRNSLKSGLTNLFKEFENKRVKFITDPKVLFQSHINNSAAIESISSDVLNKLGGDGFTVSYRDGEKPKSDKNKNIVGYKFAPYIDLSKYVLDNKIGDYPATIELPAEAVIPIIVEGSPDVHIGYFVTINENGVPVSINNDMYSDLMSSTYGSQRINRLFSAYYSGGHLSINQKLATDAKFEILNAIYDGYVNNLMTTKLSDMGLDNHRVELNSAVTRVMFSRLLKGTETRIVFVPKKLMNYLAYKYNTDGTGRSKLEDIKFPLSLKMTFVIVRLISLIESAINRRTLNISLDDTSGNPLELLKMIKRDVLNNKMYGLSYDPSTIIKTVQDKGLTIVPDKLPGVESFSITDTPNNVEYPRPDDAILEEINNMYMLSLDVPPSALNRLSEEEFSRSVAANNIFFSNKVRAYQRITCEFMTDFVKSYINFSKALKESLKEILEKEDLESTKEEIAVEGVKADTDSLKDQDEEKLTINDRLDEIIRNLEFTLPSPNLIHDKSSFEELTEYINMVTAILETLYPDDMVANEEIMTSIKVLRATLKRTIISDHIKNNSLLSDINFDALSNVEIVESVSATQKILNLKKALDGVITAFQTEQPEPNPGWS